MHTKKHSQTPLSEKIAIFFLTQGVIALIIIIISWAMNGFQWPFH